MDTNQMKLLKALAKDLKAQKRDKSTAIASLHSAGILTKKGEFAKPYRNLNRIVIKK